MDKTQLKNQLITFTRQRYEAHAAKDLYDFIFANYLFQTVDPALIDFAYTFRQDIVDYFSNQDQLEAFIEYCIRATKHYTYKRNQFINFSKSYDQLLFAEYQDFFEQIKAFLKKANSFEALTEAFGTLVSTHHERLRLILSSYCLACHTHDLEENPLLRTVPCEEYSVPFQLSLFNIDLAELREPILDVGCGTSGTFVNFLRNMGYVIFGVDRLAPSKPYFFQQDWFDFDYAKNSWGTVIAHQSLSTHFIYNHLHNPGNATQYANLFMSILSSLKLDGAFYYAPGLPFFEDQLENMKHYSICKTPILLGNGKPGLGGIAYAAKVRRNY
jgi:hypothetical protein